MTERRVVMAGCLAGAVLLAGVQVIRSHRPAPEPVAGAVATHADAMLIVVDGKNRLYIDGRMTDPGELVPRVQRAMLRKQVRAVYLKGDKNARYAAILDVMETLRQAHIDVHLI